MAWRSSGSSMDNLVKPLAKSASSHRYSRHLAGSSSNLLRKQQRPLTSKVLRASTPCLSSREQHQVEESLRSSTQDWITSMQVRLENRSVEGSIGRTEPKKMESTASSNSLSLLPLARDVAGSNRTNENINGLRSTMGRAFRFNQEGFHKARSHPCVVQPQIKIAVEGERMLSTEKSEIFSKKNLSTNKDSQVQNGHAKKDQRPLKVTSYREDFGSSKPDNKSIRPNYGSVNTLHGHNDYSRAMPTVQRDHLTVSRPSVQMSSLTTYRRNTDRSLNYVNLKPALRFDRQHRIPDQIDWI